MAHAGEPLLQRPLYVFDLPEEILLTLQAKSQTDSTPTAPADTLPSTPTSEIQDGAPTTATSCALCGLAFPNVQEQRSHVRSDLHGYNLKQKMRGLQPVGEEDFDKLVGDLDESISGTDSSDSGSDSEDEEASGTGRKESTLSALLKKQAKLSASDMDDFAPKKRKRGSGKPPLVWFSTPKLPENTSLGIYRAIFSDAEQVEESHLVETIRKKQLPPTAPPKAPPTNPDSGGVALPSPAVVGPHYFLCMIGGGHFAAMLVSLAPKLTKKGGLDERNATVLAHKTFHRYTTRRKQGGAQSANDSAKGAAHSAGSSLRRYNEAALTTEVRALLSEWKAMIDTAELCFIRATGTTNRRTLFGPYDGQVLQQNDLRNRGFPFSTRRATQAELMRSFVELTRVKISTVDEAALAAASVAQESAKAAASASAKTSLPSKPSKPTPSKVDEEALLHTTQLQSLIRRSKAPALLPYLHSNDLPASYHFFPPDAPAHHHAPTPLHLAASLNSPTLVHALLVKAGADPAVRSAEGKTAFEIAGDRGTRDAFRVARWEIEAAQTSTSVANGDGKQGSKGGEALRHNWDWAAASVPPALSPASAAAVRAREKADGEAEKAAEAERRRAETERLRQEDREKEEKRREGRFGKGRVAGGGGVLKVQEMTAQERREEDAKGLTPEARMRLERERRARAAEERMRRA
ncbi:hypothetical protein B0A49_10224 [Cryomyces minteri]|uniref:VLRF1 domain-containing protein n=1 Tax=Cryomyces minteri TaxID=331657 RepID=A0A4U0WQ19_9PEZI|nr:hypothetical protein B0A49_10224 [Cryomyces minteri]